MSQVREVIELLTKVCEDNGTVPIKAECFRAAKFDKCETTSSLWRLLFELTYILKYGQLEDFIKDFIDQLKKDDMVIYTKCFMQDQGYFSKEFSTLPNDMSSGSREVLLAIGWLLSSKKVIEKFVDLQSSPLDQEYPTQESLQIVTEQKLHHSGELPAAQKAQQLQFLNGRLSLSLKTLYSLYHEETRLLHKVHESTLGVGTSTHSPHLSMMEVYLLRHPEHSKKCIKQLEKDNRRLERLLQWKEHEHVFWKWMESVLQLKMEEVSHHEDQGRDQRMVHYNIPGDLLSSVSMSRRNLESNIMKFEPIITQLEEIWETKQHDITIGQKQRIEAAVNTEIQACKQSLQEDNELKNGLPLYRNTRLLFVKPSVKKSSNIQIPNSNNMSTDGICDPVDLQSEITNIQAYVNQLECELQRKERYYRERLDKMASDIPGAICIQPASLTK
ncbi:LOW QUALITY PROTEIN: tubulin epsilon and delta complex protein 1-like [Ruditapes philippinarum]|uniref:LOW QUALITY PROTEIN: tubulin epsilon and delta complex protein 1-like n=1 Tax=Ruditapes philippinarum TaxID=129788 RepID=UPI00295C0384|nr:LOW QUALITY PROTEIN: tubulin epsilon and delta complex protein 1-like [Ruditapes philippinarum]